MSKKFQLLLSTLVLLSALSACNNNAEAQEPQNLVSISDHENRLSLLERTHPTLPHGYIVFDTVQQPVYAAYGDATDRYRHGVFGNSVEGGSLTVMYKGTLYTHRLSDTYVFEDVAPKLWDVDADGIPEIITIKTHLNKGAGITIYKVSEKGIERHAYVPEIGTSNRWLNIAAIGNLDMDTETEIAWVQTPHIGGILKYTKIKAGKCLPLAELSGYSNHGYRSKNLCLSVMSIDDKNRKVLRIPTQDRKNLALIILDNNGTWCEIGRQSMDINFEQPLSIPKNIKNNDLFHTGCTSGNNQK